MVKGERVCSGIADLASFILSNELSSKCKTLATPSHAFNIAECEEGSILFDPTRDLKLCALGSFPVEFGESQEEFTRVRNHQFKPEDVSDFKPIIEIPEQEKRAIHMALGIAGEDGCFPAPLNVSRLEVAERFKAGEIDEGQAVSAFLEKMEEILPKEYVQARIEILDAFLLKAGIAGKTMYLYDRNVTPQMNSRLTFITSERTFIYDGRDGRMTEVSNEELMGMFVPHNHNQEAVQAFGKMFAEQEQIRPVFKVVK